MPTTTFFQLYYYHYTCPAPVASHQRRVRSDDGRRVGMRNGKGVRVLFTAAGGVKTVIVVAAGKGSVRVLFTAAGGVKLPPLRSGARGERIRKVMADAQTRLQSMAN